MDVTDIDTSKLTHSHFAFATVTKDFDVSVEAVKDQFAKYKSMKTSAKKILSFRG
jgi:GH18 family chitinase